LVSLAVGPHRQSPPSGGCLSTRKVKCASSDIIRDKNVERCRRESTISATGAIAQPQNTIGRGPPKSDWDQNYEWLADPDFEQADAIPSHIESPAGHTAAAVRVADTDDRAGAHVPMATIPLSPPSTTPMNPSLGDRVTKETALPLQT
jgi:hypothetical protein